MLLNQQFIGLKVDRFMPGRLAPSETLLVGQKHERTLPLLWT